MGRPTPQDATAGLVTGLFSVPEGMAYAAIAGFSPASGLYSGIMPTIFGSLFSRTVLMVTTLTSAIALSAKSVLQSAGLQPTIGNIATLSLLVGLVMLLLGWLKLGSILNFVSNAVMTGFTTGIAVQIVAGVLSDATGYKTDRHNTLAKFADVFSHISQWSWPAVWTTVACVAVWVVARLIKPLRTAATLIALVVASAGVAIVGLRITMASDIGVVPDGLPPLTLPDIETMPKLALGAVAIAAVALAQAASISSAVPNPDKSRSNVSSDFVAQGAANVAGALFGALPTGGSLSRTAVAASAGGRSRWTGIFAGVFLALFVVLAGSVVAYIPMAVIAGLIIVIGVELIQGRWGDIVMVLRTSWTSTIAMLVTFICTTQLPLQQAILIGAILSLLLYVGTLAKRSRIRAMVPAPEHRWELSEVPDKLADREIAVITYGGITLFAAIARLNEEWPDTTEATNCVIILDLRTVADVPSTVLVKALQGKAAELRREGNLLMLAGLEPVSRRYMQATGVLDAVGEANVFLARDQIHYSLDKAYAAGKAWIEAQDRRGPIERVETHGPEGTPDIELNGDDDGPPQADDGAPGAG